MFHDVSIKVRKSKNIGVNSKYNNQVTARNPKIQIALKKLNLILTAMSNSYQYEKNLHIKTTKKKKYQLSNLKLRSYFNRKICRPKKTREENTGIENKKSQKK